LRLSPGGSVEEGRLRAALFVSYDSVVRRLLVLAALPVLRSCGGSQQALHGGTGGLQGKVARGPITPICTLGKPCSAPARGLTLSFSRDGQVVARGQTGNDGGNSSGGPQCAILACLAFGCRCWPIVTTSTPFSRRSRIVSTISSLVSPRPTMIPDFVRTG